jgi:RNA polymerase sigma-70 factor (ECF subfamily)
MTDREIIRLFQQRDERGIEETQKAYGAQLMRFAERFLSWEDAEECVNDTYLAVWNHIPPAEPDHFQAYLFKITGNQVWRRVREQSAGKREADVVELTNELAEILPSHAIGTEEQAIENVSGSLQRFMASQKPEQRHVFFSRYWLGETVGEISERTGFTESKVQKILSRMKKRLKQFMEKE